jgi:predicted RNA-binding protein (virulence factor B family)
MHTRLHESLLGRIVPLTIVRLEPPGAYLAGGDDIPPLLLPSAEVPEDASPGDTLDVFVYLDSETRPIATRVRPRIVLDEVAFLEVTDLVPFGAFVDWGLSKELLVPLAEQTRSLAVGDRHPIGLYVDASGRLAGTMRVAEMLAPGGDFEVGTWVEGEAWRNEPRIGLFVILERRFVGLVPADEPHTLQRGDSASFRVATRLEDGKLTLSLRRHALEERPEDAERILSTLRGGRHRVGNHSSPAQVRALFGMSKKAFKRAVGLLLREGKVDFDEDGNLRVVARRRIVG